MTIRLKEKQEENRQAKSKWNMDLSRYDLLSGLKSSATCENEAWHGSWSSSAIDEGMNFDWLKAQLTPYRFLAIHGELSSNEFLKAAATAKTPSGSAFDMGIFSLMTDSYSRLEAGPTL